MFDNHLLTYNIWKNNHFFDIPNIPLDETIDICVNQLFENTDTVEGFTKSELKQLLSLATKESYFIFNGLLYKQIDGVAMGSPLGPSLANAFLSYHEKKTG